MMGADNQAERVIERMEREKLLADAAIHLLRTLRSHSIYSNEVSHALLDLGRAVTACGYHIDGDPPP